MERVNFSVGCFGGKWGYKPVGKFGCRNFPRVMGEKHNRQAILYPWYDYLARLWIKSPEMCLMPRIKRQTAHFSVESPVQIYGITVIPKVHGVLPLPQSLILYY